MSFWCQYLKLVVYNVICHHITFRFVLMLVLQQCTSRLLWKTASRRSCNHLSLKLCSSAHAFVKPKSSSETPTLTSPWSPCNGSQVCVLYWLHSCEEFHLRLSDKKALIQLGSALSATSRTTRLRRSFRIIAKRKSDRILIRNLFLHPPVMMSLMDLKSPF